MKTQAAFVNKLYKMLEDPQTSKLISWSTQGDLFSVSNPTLFSKSVLPQYFKHNNWQSFVRQLNMYGFHKVNDLIHSNLTNENQTWEFKHPHFRRGAVSDLQHIKRKSAKTHIQLQKQQDSPDDTPHHQHHPHHPHPHQQQQQHQPHPAHLLADMDSPKESLTDVGMEDHVHRIESHLLSVSKSCELLYSEVVNLRSVVSKQQAAMQDLVDVVSACQFNPSQKDCHCQDEKTNGTPHFSTPPLTHHLLHETEKTSAFRRPADTLGAYVSPPFRKLTLIDSLASDTFYHKSLPITERNHSMMSFGKESHMLNPSG
ncbi:HSF-type DNA-binding-domain-containing protein [Sporodiniella umbellata]|nr:HSF-type DNA-binding-domain-containing protein [Sporodiniella umbellata]